MLLPAILRSVIKEGALGVIDARGKRHHIGTGTPSGTIHLLDPGLDRKIALNPKLAFLEAYMEGSLTFPEGGLREVLDLLARNYTRLERNSAVRIASWLRLQFGWAKQYNPIGRAQRNIAHHYDLSGALYDLFLDADKQYSCGYFTSPADSLDEAQEHKKRHIAAKLLLERPGLKVLDIGSGWGGMGLYLAQIADCDVTGVTLSSEQHRVSQTRAEEAHLADRCRFQLKDYRLETGPYDRIVSVGMFEHVGKQNYHEFFAKVRDLLSDDGVCLLHSIGRFDPPSATHPFIRKYIFPGGDVPSLSEILPIVERLGLYVTDIEILRLHYAETLRHWYERFQANRDKVAKLYDERFCRMWEAYLVTCEMGFRYVNLMVFQLQLSKRLETVPLTRDYITAWERAHGMPVAESARRRVQAAQ